MDSEGVYKICLCYNLLTGSIFSACYVIITNDREDLLKLERFRLPST